MSATGISRPDNRDWLKLFGGLLFAAGAIVLALRKRDDWSDWAQFLVLLVATVVLFAAAVLGARALQALAGWESALYVFAILLLPATLLQLVNAIDDQADGNINSFWIFGLSAGVAAAIALRRGLRWQMLIAGLYLIASWIGLWSKILSNPSGNTIRWLLVAIAAILLLGAATLVRRGLPQAGDLITAAGIAAILPALIGATVSLGQALNQTGVGGDNTKPTEGWNVYLLVISLALIGYGALATVRGPSYVGAFGFGVFILLTGFDLVSSLKGDDTNGVGWPLILLILGALALAGGFAGPRIQTAAPPPPPPPPPGPQPPQ
jgi:hypothetical protein